MRRTRLLLAAGALVLLTMLSAAHPASAEGKFADHAAEECHKLLEKGKTIDDCQAAPSPILPELNEIIWGTVGFLIVFGAIAKFGYPAMKKGMDARTERIRGDLDEAEATKTEAGTVLAQYQAQLADARTESARIIEEARQDADGVRTNLQTKAESDIAELRAKANAEIETAKAQAMTDLRTEVTALAIGAAERVVEHNLDRDTSIALVESYIEQVGATR